MGIFKSKTSLFGSKIEPDCAYCTNNTAGGCLRQNEIKNGKCSAFDYDPLLRRPKVAPPLPVPDAKEFEL